MRDLLKNIFQRLLTKKYQLSLAVFIPCFLVMFAFGPMYISIKNVEKLAQSVSPDALRETLNMMRLVMWISVTAALAAGLAIAYSILSPVKRFMEGSRAFMADEQRTELEDDFAILGKDFSMVMGSLSRYVSILEGMSGGVIAFDRDGRVTAVNPTAERIFAQNSREILGRPLAYLCGTIVQSPDMERIVLDGLQHNRSYSSREVRIRGAVDNADRRNRNIAIGVTTSLLKDADGKTTGLVANFLDLTGIKQMHEDLQQRLRLASLGRLAAGVAHEVRNPLGAIKGMAQLIQEGMSDQDPRKKYSNIIAQETDRLNRVVEELLGLTQGAVAREKCDVNALLVHARDLAVHGSGGKLFPEGSRLAVLGDTGEIPEIMGERGRLVQAFLNVFLNALEAVSAGGKVWFKTFYLSETHSISVEIGNTGPPISQEVKERMFDPFFTTKEKGSGLGLAISHQIITSHGGSISADSTESETIFRITLPAV
jgi:two-component system sensor histidine kinase AtoS